MESEQPMLMGRRDNHDRDLAPDANKVPKVDVDIAKSPEAIRQKEELLVNEARVKRDELLLSKATLSKEDFLKHFSSSTKELKVEAKQQNVGNCYLIAAIHAMSMSPHFELMCRTSMKMLPDGSWKVFIPLMNKEGKEIIVTAEDISLKGNGENGDLLPVHALAGIRVLEAAWIKYKFGENNRAASIGGHADEALFLFGGDSFKRKFIGDVPSHHKEGSDVGSLDSLSDEMMAELDYSLNNYDPAYEIATVASRHDMPDEYAVEGTSIKIKSKHAYSVTACDTKKQVITIADSHDTSIPISLTFEQFKKSFMAYKGVVIDFSNLLANMKEQQQ